MQKNEVPTYKDLLWPTLKALEDRGGSASIYELSQDIASRMQLTDDILDIRHNEGPQSEVDYRAGWARTHLKQIDAVRNSARGIWAITAFGRKIETEKKLRDLVKDERKQQGKARRTQKKGPANDEEEDAGWEQRLLGIIRGIAPDAFERLCQLVLRESGFTKVEVTGRSGDEGIDGAGVLRVNLISFHVRFQCKRYTQSVGSSAIRDFRGAMVGRADKGLFITTGSFTKGAEREAVRDGAPAIDLIDGSALCAHLKKLELGVSVKMEEVVTPKKEFFEKL